MEAAERAMRVWRDRSGEVRWWIGMTNYGSVVEAQGTDVLGVGVICVD